MSMKDDEMDVNVPVEMASEDQKSDICLTWSCQMKSVSVWIFIVIAIVVIVIVEYLIGREGLEWFRTLDMADWCKNNTMILNVMMVLTVLLFTWGVANAYNTSSSVNKQNMILVGFALNLIALIALVAIMYRKDDDGSYNCESFTTAFWIALLSVIITFAMLFPMWENKIACLALLPYLVFILIIIYLLSDMNIRHGRWVPPQGRSHHNVHSREESW